MHSLKLFAALQKAFVNVVSSSLVQSPNFKLTDDHVRSSIIHIADQLASVDPQFILKVSSNHVYRCPTLKAVIVLEQISVFLLRSWRALAQFVIKERVIIQVHSWFVRQNQPLIVL